jgi:menaquinone-dependent protoporphyrinogen oxidase
VESSGRTARKDEIAAAPGRWRSKDMKKISIVYESVEGHTQTVAERIGSILKGAGCQVALVRCKAATEPMLKDADGILLGGSIHAGKHNAKLVRFTGAHRGILESKRTAFFLVCLTARSNTPEDLSEVEGYLKDFEQRTGFSPDLSQAFGGALLYTKYNFLKRGLMKSITKKQGGDIDTSRDFIYTDWDAVDAFAREFLERLV